MFSRRDLIIATVVFAATFWTFKLSPVHVLADSKFEMLFSEQLLWNHSFSVEPSAFADMQSGPLEQLQRGIDFPYHLELVDNRFYYWFPPGSTILSTPYVALENARGISARDKNGRYNEIGDTRIQAGLAALLMAGLSAVTYFTARLFLSRSWSLVITIMIAFATPVWSVASRTLWIHTWAIFILALVIWMIAQAERSGRRLRPVFLATCLSWLYFVRPICGISILAITIYVFIFHRAVFLPFLLTGCAWLTAFVTYSLYHFGHVQPLYYRSQPHNVQFASSFWEGVAGTLVSPARGLLVYVPIVLFIAYLLVRYRTDLRPRLTILAAGTAFIHFIIISGYLRWYGGHSYGPRYWTDIIPWFALLTILAVEARLKGGGMRELSRPGIRGHVEWALAMVLLIWSIALNGIGAISLEASRWNVIPTDIDQDRSRLWDWRHPPFLQPWASHHER